MEISLIIPAYNEEKIIATCLDSIERNCKGLLKEVIVVDNGSTDRTVEIVSRYPHVRLVHEPRQGTGNARQSGFEASGGEIVAYVDADTMVPPGWVEAIHTYFQADSKLVLLSGPYRYFESEKYPLWLLNLMWWIALPAYWVVGYMANAGNCVMRADALKRIGGHDRSLAFYGDDTDLARRMNAVGTTLWKSHFNNISSGRRFDDFGLIATCLGYALNFWWPVLFHRPYTPGHHYTKAQEHKAA